MKQKKQNDDYKYLCDSHVNSPVANSKKVDRRSGVTYPSADDVREAKAWVDDNEK